MTLRVPLAHERTDLGGGADHFGAGFRHGRGNCCIHRRLVATARRILGRLIFFLAAAALLLGVFLGITAAHVAEATRAVVGPPAIVCAAAVASARWRGLGKKNDADGAAVDAMRKSFNDAPFDGRVVIGEGEIDEAPMLYIGEKVGTGKGAKVDIALDPLEGTTITAKGLPNGLAVLAMAEHGASVVVSSRKLDACEEVVKEIQGKGGKAKAIACNIGYREQVEARIIKTGFHPASAVYAKMKR